MKRFCIKHPVFSEILRALKIDHAFTVPSSLDPRIELLSQRSSDWRDRLGCSSKAGIFIGCHRNPRASQTTQACLFWCPQGWPDGRFTSLCSSRLGQRLRQEPHIANALRNFFLAITDNQWVITAGRTTLESPLSRGCQLFRIPQLDLQPFPKRISQRWLRQSARSCEPGSIRIWFDSNAVSADELLFSLCDELRILFMRPAGKIERLVDQYVLTAQGPQLWRLVDNPSQSPSKSKENVNPKIIDWHLLPSQDGSHVTRSDGKPEIKPLGAWATDYLNHWTRFARKPWPDRNELNQFDPLFFESTGSLSPLGTLLRILASRTLLASGALIPQKQRVVCFTEVPLTEFSQRRIYRPHLSRWDFEPWGISIRKSTLQRLHARPVEYGSQELEVAANQPMRRLAPDEALSQSEFWKGEREWRVVGDLDLRQISRKDAVVFVPDMAAATTLAAYTDWPFTIVGSVDPTA